MQPQCHLDKPVAYASPKNLSSIKLICWELQILLAPYLLNQNHTNVITQKTWKNPIQNPNSWNLKNKRSDWKGTLTKRSKVLKILMHACVFFEEDLERLVTLMRLCLRNEERFEDDSLTYPSLFIAWATCFDGASDAEPSEDRGGGGVEVKNGVVVACCCCCVCCICICIF